MFCWDWTSGIHQRFTIFFQGGWNRHSAHGGLHSVEGRTVLEPVDLLGVEGVVQHNGVRASVRVRQHAIQGLKRGFVINLEVLALCYNFL